MDCVWVDTGPNESGPKMAIAPRFTREQTEKKIKY